MRSHRVPWRVARLLIIPPITFVLAVVPACAGHHGSAAPATSATTTSTAAPTTSRPDPTAAVLAAYQRFWQVWLEANDPPDPNDPALAEVASGPQLALEKAQIARNLQGGVAFVPARPSHAQHRPSVVDLSAHRATVVDCALDDGVVVARATNTVLNADVVTYLWRATLTNKGGRWKVTDNTREGKWSGASDCDLGT